MHLQVALAIHRALHDPSVSHLDGPLEGLLAAGESVPKEKKSWKGGNAFWFPTCDMPLEDQKSSYCLVSFHSQKQDGSPGASMDCKKAHEGACITQVYIGGYPGRTAPRPGQAGDRERGTMESLSYNSPVTLTRDATCKMEADWIDAEPGEFTERTFLGPDEACGLPYCDASRMHVLRGNYERSAEQQAERDAELAQITMRPAHLKKLKSGELGRRVMLSEIGIIENARTGASGCKVCHAKIAKGAVRLGIYYKFKQDISKCWIHPRCAGGEYNLEAVTAAELGAVVSILAQLLPRASVLCATAMPWRRLLLRCVVCVQKGFKPEMLQDNFDLK